jgi:hypothetical protein
VSDNEVVGLPDYYDTTAFGMTLCESEHDSVVMADFRVLIRHQPVKLLCESCAKEVSSQYALQVSGKRQRPSG